MTPMDAHTALLRLLTKLEQATRDGHVWIGAGDAENALDAISLLNRNAEHHLCP